MIYICGDSFAVPDPDYGPCWVDLLSDKIKKPITNLSKVCASNAFISKQVDTIGQADFVIVLFTSSSRFETRINDKIVTYSILGLDETTPFNKHQREILRNYAAEFFNLDLEIFRNRCIIEATLYRIQNKKVPFLFDQGGFEHSSYGINKKYFENFDQFRSKYNLWDYANTAVYRPYYHITDPKIHEAVASYYYKIINEQT
jgi:hypothetical protein